MSGLRLKLLAEQARAGDIVLLHADESEALTHPYLAYAWAKRGADLRVAAPGPSKKVAMLGALDTASGQLVVRTSRINRSADFVRFLEMPGRLYGPPPPRSARPVVLVLDNGPIHVSKKTTTALAARPWLGVERLPKYAPELNDIERSWRDLKPHHLAHRTFRHVEDLESSSRATVADLNRERSTHPCDNLRIAA
jgi:hypothetical protein